MNPSSLRIVAKKLFSALGFAVLAGCEAATLEGPGADLKVSIINTPLSLPAVGSTKIITVRVSNEGPNSVTNAPVRITMSEGYPVSWTCASSDAAGCSSGGTGNIVGTVRLEADAYVDYVMIAEATSRTNPMEVTAVVTAPEDVIDPNPSNNSVSVVMLPEANLGVALQAESATTKGSEPIKLNVSVTNAGPYVAEGVTLKLEAPLGASFQGGVGAGWTCTPSGNILSCTIPSLPVGVTTIETTVVPPPNLTQVPITATLSTDKNADSEPANNTVTTQHVVTDPVRTRVAGGGFGCNAVGATSQPLGSLAGFALLSMVTAAYRMWRRKTKAKAMV